MRKSRAIFEDTVNDINKISPTADSVVHEIFSQSG